MAEKVWELVVKTMKDEKTIQKAILEGVGIALGVVALIAFYLLLVAVKRSIMV